MSASGPKAEVCPREEINELVAHLVRDEASKVKIDQIKLNPNVEASDLGEEMHRFVNLARESSGAPCAS
jgi:hypothetical protein